MILNSGASAIPIEPSLRVLRYVVAAAECGHVTKAARRLNVSQPSVSSAIAELEASTGVQLFVRHHARGVSLTPAGERVINDARILLKHAREFMHNAAELGSELRGEIAVGCFHTLAVRFMPALLSRFSRMHPGIAVALQEGDQAELLAMLLSGRTELVLSYSFALPDEIAPEPLADLPPFAIVSADHPCAGEKQVSLRTLAEEPFVLLDLPHSRDYFSSLFRAVGVEPRIVFRSRSHELIRGLVAHGHGFAIQNAIPATTLVYDGGRVAVLALAEDLPPTRIMSLRLKRHTLRPAVAAFAAFLTEAFGPTGMFAPGSVIAPRTDDAAHSAADRT
jgi:DNA-binding transcriptional LysR family regulator